MIKLYDIITIILIAYITLMAYWARDLIMVYNKYFEYFSLIAISLGFIFALRYTIKRKNKNDNDDED